METTSQQKLHSQDYFNEQRNFWWNDDFLALLAKRWNFTSAKSVLDVGCGVGHWGRLLAGLLDRDCQIVGVDRESEWISQASKMAERSGLLQTFHYHVADAHSLPFPDESFDIVTCQTVLMHLKDPKKALNEFMRVLKPNGRIIAAEPNNMVSNLMFDSVSVNDDIDDVVGRVRFYLICERGKRELGEGYSSIGDLLPGMFAQVGLEDIQVYNSDKASALIPPYSSPEQQVNLNQMRDYHTKQIMPWDFNETRRYYLAGGGVAEKFENFWRLQLRLGSDRLKAIADETYHTAGGAVFYLVSGKKVS
jgi:SAM-dependent methyltransferase